VHANQRKLITADSGDEHVTLVTSGNFEDSGSFFGDTAVTIRSSAVARHYLEAEKALAHASGHEIPVWISDHGSGSGDALVEPLLGDRIKQALLGDIAHSTPDDHLYVFAQFLSDRDLIESLVAASSRGVSGCVVLDQNKVSFGTPKRGFPNQVLAPELARRTRFAIRWANTENEEYHNQFVLVQKPDRCVLHAGSANFSRRGLSNTVLEANVRIEAPVTATVCRQALAFAGWMTQEPRSLPFDAARQRHPWPAYWLVRFQEATGTGKF
jgi:phosphatidylserine/phosphatidylglycerophosphate/cardiolipin synthase-like enzyme